MKRTSALFSLAALLLLVALFPVGCGASGNNEPDGDFNSNQFIAADGLPVEEIKVEGATADGMGYDAAIVRDPQKIQAAVQLLSDIKLKQLSPDEEIAIMDNGKKVLEGDNYFIILKNSEGIAGTVFALSEEGLIMVADIATMTGDARTVSYININAETETVGELLDILLSN